jgi:protein-S-isoprenylcysteine O-methyltransferase Ste14
VAFVITGAGIAFAFNTYWMFVSLLAFVLLANKLVFEREEKYLEGKFGESYLSYRRETRRWL